MELQLLQLILGPAPDHFIKEAPLQVCRYFMEGRCNRNPCNFLHPDHPSHAHVASHSTAAPAGNYMSAYNGATSKHSNFASDIIDPASIQAGGAGAGGKSTCNRRKAWGRSWQLRPADGKVSTANLGHDKSGKHGRCSTSRSRDGDGHMKKLCHFFLRGTCNKGDQCNFIHSFTDSDDISLVTQLSGHEKAVSAVALPARSNKLYTAGGQDGTIRVWDCDSGQCANVFRMGSAAGADVNVGCLLAEAGWLFVGLPNEVKACNLQSGAVQALSTGPASIGQVHCLAMVNGMLMAGAEDGNILAWKFNSVANMFEPLAALRGHTGGVVTLEAAYSSTTQEEGKLLLYSGSKDFTIKVWDVNTAMCIQTLQGHSDVVTGLILAHAGNQYLLSGSLDGTVKVWAAAASSYHELQNTYIFPKDAVLRTAGIHCNEEMADAGGVLAFCGFVDEQNRNILICSLNDNTIRLLEIPSFTERAVLYSLQDEVRALQVGPAGLIFSGDGSGFVKVWKWAPASNQSCAGVADVKDQKLGAD